MSPAGLHVKMVGIRVVLGVVANGRRRGAVYGILNLVMGRVEIMQW